MSYHLPRLQEPVPGTSGGMSSAEARARAALVKLDQREPEAARNIKAIGKEPNGVPESILTLDRIDLYKPGNRSERRQILLRHAIQYLFNIPIQDGKDQDRVIARMGARIKLMVDFMINVWEDMLRPKTWMDTLSAEQQQSWADAKKRYDRSIENENRKLAKAKQEYDRVVQEVSIAQATARQELKDMLQGYGIVNAPLLQEPSEDEGLLKLQGDMSRLGINFRPPDAGFY